MLKRLTDYLDKNSIKYVQLTHSPAYTASEVAATAHMPGRMMAKAVIAVTEGKMTVLVLPAASMVDFGVLRNAMNVSDIRLATETEFKEIFKDCEIGAMPPFGNLFGLDTVVDRGLTGTHDIAFNAGNHKELIRLSYPDFERLARPRILSFGILRKAQEDEVDVMP